MCSNACRVVEILSGTLGHSCLYCAFNCRHVDTFHALNTHTQKLQYKLATTNAHTCKAIVAVTEIQLSLCASSSPETVVHLGDVSAVHKWCECCDGQKWCSRRKGWGPLQ
eukprot:Blabericola_migrator_1__7077@NODE_358_length_9448_cov_212_227694_g286_i0_p7_GENE_NODE_358_length_9448_cov_212_227694_g286_i0NODE_358_length_9448_cov_212_227694_g286_i0_p7_ORF_typecomplete_len110_score0_68HpaP/PF09483_10/0_046HpaP/PF09483_10/1_2e02_NODE_358_length_9448_cov_212_227694_g286_i085158844